MAVKWIWNHFDAGVGTFWSAVASILPLMRRLVPPEGVRELDRVSLELKAKIRGKLRKTLRDWPLNSRPSMTLIYQVKALFREVTTSGDKHSASIHAKGLFWLAEKLPIRECQGGEDVLNWMPQIIATTWNSAKSVLPTYHKAHIFLPGSVLSPQPREAFRHIPRALNIGKISMPPSWRRAPQMLAHS
ncbi:uncharacterized protein A1O5_12698 [Cladophialophora psammophila CBS 110553]|uniref:Uncharacterized protein n=1 Tax=Cladophialophora psammophila CBS 110553 TaxID=1182543 RepID=W9VKN2_9EURO|nr:uncharacterized protein A1O5_12698 [Cladophialophora psammophila CBS 110553]EXJ56242.1 hypothetical protein A1O5_12698 [Cladophialophora psammophila CBS 110553]